MKKRLISILFIFILIFSLMLSILSTPAGAFTPSSFDISAESALLISLDGNSKIFEKEPDKKMYSASLVKIMTSVIILDKSAEGDMIPVTQAALDELIGISYNAYGFTEGEALSVEQIIAAIMLASSNEAAHIAAHYYAGGTEKFVELMNQKATELGMSGTNYTNVTGFHDDNQYTTASDLYKLIKYAMEDERFEPIVSTRLYTMEGTQQHPDTRYILNSNWLIDSATTYYYRNATGVKNGTSDESGRCLVATAAKNKRTYVCILLGCPTEDKDGNDVFYDYTDAKNLFEWAFNDFEHKAVVDIAQPVCEAEVKYSSDNDYVTLFPKDELYATIPRSADNSTIQITPELNEEVFTAPIEKGSVLGKAKVSYAGVELGEIELIAADSVERSFLLASISEIGKFVKTPWFIGGVAVIIALLIFRKLITDHNRKKRREKRVKNYRRM